MPTEHDPYAPHTDAPEADIKATEAEESQEPKETEEAPEEATQGVPEGSAADVLAWVGEDKDRAKEALEVEQAGQQRIGLSRKLKELAESE